MGKTIYANVFSDGPDGPKYFEVGDEVPDDYVELIRNPSVWEKPKPGDDNYVAPEPEAPQNPDKLRIKDLTTENDALKARVAELEKQNGAEDLKAEKEALETQVKELQEQLAKAQKSDEKPKDDKSKKAHESKN